jgi:hypothetical protein
MSVVRLTLIAVLVILEVPCAATFGWKFSMACALLRDLRLGFALLPLVDSMGSTPSVETALNIAPAEAALPGLRNADIAHIVNPSSGTPACRSAQTKGVEMPSWTEMYAHALYMAEAQHSPACVQCAGRHVGLS